MPNPKQRNDSSTARTLTEWPRKLPPISWNTHLAKEKPTASGRPTPMPQSDEETIPTWALNVPTGVFGSQSINVSPAIQDQELSSVQVVLEAAQTLSSFLERRGITVQKDVHLELVNLVARNAFRRQTPPNGEDVATLFAFWVLRMEEVEPEQAVEETQAS